MTMYVQSEPPFCSVIKSEFSTADAFIGFQNDTPAAVVFQATNIVRTGSHEEVCIHICMYVYTYMAKGVTYI